MLQHQKTINLLRYLCILLLLGLLGCQNTDKEQQAFMGSASYKSLPAAVNPHYLALSNVWHAPSAIKEASRAVVRLATVNSRGTAFFISREGVLLTNEHVLGAKRCAQSGCFIRLDFQLEAGKKSENRKVFAKPVAISPQLDVAAYQIYQVNKGVVGDKLHVEHALELLDVDPSQLMGKFIYTVGHPSAALKKWSKGSVFAINGHLISTNGFILPGSSGSPVLNDKGQVVGIFHSSQAAEVLLKGMRVDTFATASSYLLKWLRDSEQHPQQMAKLLHNIHAPVPAEKFHKKHWVYLQSKTSVVEIQMGDGKLELMHPAAVLAKRIDLALDNITRRSDASKLMELISASMLWLSCHKESHKKYKMCPSDAEKEHWQERVKKFSNETKHFFGASAYPMLAKLAFLFAENAKQGKKLAREVILQQVDGGFNLDLVVSLTPYFSPDFTMKLKGQNIREFVLGFRKIPYYEYSLGEVLTVLESLKAVQQVGYKEYVDALRYISTHPMLTLTDQLFLEIIAYRNGLLAE